MTATFATNVLSNRTLVTASLVSSILFAFSACRERAAAANAETAGDSERPGGAVTQWTDSTELFMEYPALIVGRPEKFAVHLTDLTDFAPLRSGPITLRFQPRDGGAALVVRQDVPRAPGIYGPSPEFTKPGIYDLTLLVESPQAHDSIFVPGLRVFASVAEMPEAEEAGGEDGIPFLKEQQWKTPGFATTFAEEGTAASTFDATGDIIPAPGRFAEVASPIAGLVDAASLSSSPTPGARVTRGQTLAVLTPSLGEGGGSVYAEARARFREAEDEHARAKRLFDAEAIPQRRLHEAEIRLTAAREALAGLAGGGALGESGRYVVRAPISGVIAERRVTPGARVDAGVPLFTIVDPSVVWLRVRVPAAVAPQVNARSGVTFRPEGMPNEVAVRRLISVGSIIDSVTRTVPVHYEVPNAGGRIKLGATARVALRSTTRQSGVLIPTAAVLDEDGRPVAYVQPDGESFQKRVLTLGGREGDRTLVLSGIKPGERVVSGAAYQVKLASLSSAVPAEGHAH
jgi:membrane fusion protein, heavy metal efflux system